MGEKILCFNDDPFKWITHEEFRIGPAEGVEGSYSTWQSCGESFYVLMYFMELTPIRVTGLGLDFRFVKLM